MIGIGISPSEGLRRGVVFDMEETVASVANSVKKAESMSGARVSRAYVSLNGSHVRTQSSRWVVVVSRADSDINQNDIDRVIYSSSTINLIFSVILSLSFPEYFSTILVKI